LSPLRKVRFTKVDKSTKFQCQVFEYPTPAENT